MNELPATVVDGHTVRVLDVPVHVTRGTELNADSQAKLLVRPEDTHFAQNGQPGLTGHVVSQTFQGVSTTVAVRLKALDTLINVHEVGSVEGRLDPGHEVKVTLDGRHAVVEAIA
jgi:ABC-type Fe3+/spermidine/putrescine transport system ATPase subunit